MAGVRSVSLITAIMLLFYNLSKLSGQEGIPFAAPCLPPAKLHFSEVILLQAIRLDAFSRFQYRVDAPGKAPFVTAEPDAAIERLRVLGIPDGARLLAHVREWGSIQMLNRESEK
jgi:hypothetical protein